MLDRILDRSPMLRIVEAVHKRAVTFTLRLASEAASSDI